ncbi:hypothetical protein FB451DRAFT_1227585 [Mycena latifolia]|nr:hypothetical protein FB451DRAFT_1227585 [Mycena latifolia]
MDLLSAHPELAPRFFKLMSDSLSESREKAKELEGRCAQADATAEMHARDLAAMVEENRRLADALAAAQVKREPESGADLTLLHAEHEDEISTLRSAKDAIIQEMSQEREELQTALDKLREKHEDQSRELKTWQADFNALNDQLTRETKELRDQLKDIMEENAAALKAIADVN